MEPVPLVTPRALDELLAAGEDVLLLDTRTETARRDFPLETRTPATQVHLPYRRLLVEAEVGMPTLPPPERAGRVVAFCERGNTSAEAVRVLRAAGYRADSLDGGLLAWSEQIVGTAVPDSTSLGADAALFQFRRLGKGCLSYVLVAGREALVVDAGRNVSAVLAAVGERGARISRVADTHLHADHLSGGPALARETGAVYALPQGDAGAVAVPHVPVQDGEIWRFGGVAVRALHTPGHTDGSTCYLVADRFLLTGDTLFVKGIGRPDLSGQGERLARVLHRTLTATVAALPDRLEVLPAHLAGPGELSGAGVASARLGALKRETLSRLPADADAFARSVLASLPEQPPNFGRIRLANRAGRADEDPAELEFGPNRCAVSPDH